VVTQPSFAELASDALRYWEPRRAVYNLALLGVVIAHGFAGWPESRSFLERDALFGLFFLAVLANLAYCAVYAVDLFVQFAGLRAAWAQWRWVVLVVGTAFAAVIAHFVLSASSAGSPAGPLA
jgi:hypothetical protein